MRLILLLLFLTSRISTSWMRYAGVRDADPSSSVLPSSLISEPSAAQSDQKTEYLPYFHAVEALNAVSARLKAQVGCDTKGNLLLSPITTTTALAQLLLGSRGSTRSQILNILTAANRTQDFAEATVNEFHKHLVNLIRIVTTNAVFDNSYYLHLASALFYRLGSGLYPNFVNAATKLYAMDIFHLDFRRDASGSLQTMNGWAAIHTFGAIDSVFTDPLPATTAGVLTNAFYFKGAWENPFNYQSTVPGKFKYNDTHRIDVQFMQGQFNLKYVESSRLGCRMVSIPYKHRQATMYVILPNTGSLYNIHEFASRLSLDDIKELTESARTTSVTLIMPKMRLAQSLSIRKTLSAFQMQVSYSSSDQNTDESDDSNFCLKNCQTFCSSEERLTFNMSGLSADKKFRMNDVVQHVFLEVNEVGTTAAAIVGTSLVDYSGEFKDFKMDRPFVFFIKHELTGSPIFCGIIMDPRNENA